METAGRMLEILAEEWALDLDALRRVHRRYAFRASPHILSLLRYPGDPIWRQVIPVEVELEDEAFALDDPLDEERRSPVPNLVHRYPNRVLWLVSNECVLHCRFCTRKRRWCNPIPMTGELRAEGIAYLRGHPEIVDVLLSGGDPLLLPIEDLESILADIRVATGVQLIRIGTRVPVADPRRITADLASRLAAHHPLFMNLHVNHPVELTPGFGVACGLLSDAGIPLGSQTVLLRGVNDDVATLGGLFQALLRFRVRPYYLMQMDLTRGTCHFRTPLTTGLGIMSRLLNRVSGLAMPRFVIDLPGGHGKIPLVPGRVARIEEAVLYFASWEGLEVPYPLLPGEAEEVGRWMARG
jgi:lysine 2,3-aminomutase